MQIRELLEAVRSGDVPVAEAEAILRWRILAVPGWILTGLSGPVILRWCFVRERLTNI